MATHKVDGFNAKEQKIFNRLLDNEPHDIREMKKIFWKDAQAHCKEVFEKGSWGDHEVEAQSQSYVRNSIRRLIRDGWVEQCARGTYRMSRTGKNRVEKGIDTTKSKTESQRGKGGGRKTKSKKAKTTKPKSKKAKTTKSKSKKAKTTKSKSAKAKTVKAKSRKKNGASKTKVSVDKVKKMKAKAKREAAKEKFSAAAAN